MTDSRDTAETQHDDLSLRRTFRFMRPYLSPDSAQLKLTAAVSGASTVLYKASLLAAGWSGKTIVDAITDGGKTRGQRKQGVLLGVSLYFIGRLGAAIFSTVQDTTFERLSQHMNCKLGTDIYSVLQRKDIAYHIHNPTGKSNEILNRGTNALSVILRVVVLQLSPTLLEAVLVSTVFVSLGSTLVACTTLASCLFYIWVTKEITRWRVKYQREIKVAENRVSSKAVESFTSIEAVKMFAREKQEISVYNRLRQELEHASVRTKGLICVFYFGQNVIVSLSVLIGMIITTYDAVYGSLSVGDFMLIHAYILALYGPMIWMGSMWGDVVAALTNMEDVMQVFAGNSPPSERNRTGDVQAAGPSHRDGDETFDVVYENVSYHYPKVDMDAEAMGGIYNVTLRLRRGSTVALVGPSGSGKSTIGRLLLGLYDCDQGRILIRGANIRDVDKRTLRSKVGVVPQETCLFDNTIRYNITYGSPQADDRTVWSAVKAAQLSQFVQAQPHGLQTVVGSRGARLSGGERQRIGAARCICKNPEIVLLDESTSALDAQTERALEANFRRMFHGRTTLIIAHRLCTIQHADEIVVVVPCADASASSVAERGTHEELLSRNGMYARMWNAQTSATDAQ